MCRFTGIIKIGKMCQKLRFLSQELLTFDNFFLLNYEPGVFLYKLEMNKLSNSLQIQRTIIQNIKKYLSI